MLRKIVINWLPLLPFFLSSCTKVASYVDPPEFHPKMVIYGYLSPDNQENKIIISSNEKRFGELNGFAPVGNVTISVKEDSKEIHLDTIREKSNFPEGYNFYIRNFQFKEGRTYTVKATSDLGLEAEASCKIPLKRNFRITVDTTFRKSIDEYNHKQSILTARISINDPDEANYYRLLYVYHSYGHHLFDNKHFSVHDTIESIPWSAEPNAWMNDRVQNDHGRNGRKFIIRVIEFQPVHLNPPGSWDKPPDSAFLRIYLLNTDKHYYDFHRSLENASLGDAPFTEPSFFYSNVKGGLGLLASYTLDSLIFRIK